MNGTREKLNTFTEARAPVREKINLPRELTLAELPRFADDAVYATRDAHADDAVYFASDDGFNVAPDKLSGTERAGYAASGTLWTAASLLAFGINGVVGFLDMGLLNLFFTTAGYLAYRQFKAALSGNRADCLRFKCTWITVKAKTASVLSSLKDFVFGRIPCANCTV